jgi:D-alanyl-D-alanine carboxypeptidase/D-alanyl-D-alanine-endopeptidase (penicillin-binding protein 4)
MRWLSSNLVAAAMCFALIPVCALAQAGVTSPDLPAQIAAMVAEPAVARAHWGVMVTAMDGTPIFALNEGQLFQPASNAKLFTTAAAMALLRPEKTFQTRVVANGSITPKGVLKGDIELVGGGDANLSGRIFPYVPPADRPKDASASPAALQYLEAMADEVVAKGLKEVDGDVVGDDTYFAWEPYATDWAVDDMVWGYGAPVSGLAVNDDQIEITVAASAKESDLAQVTFKPDVPYYSVENKVYSSNPLKLKYPILMEREPGSKVLQLTGAIGAEQKPEVQELAILDPAEYAAIALKRMLEARGVVVKGTARAQHWNPGDSMGFLDSTRPPVPGLSDGAMEGIMSGKMVSGGCFDSGRPNLGAGETVLASHTSVPLVQDVVLTNKISQNLHAEIMLRNLGFVNGCWGSIRKGAQVERQFLIHAGIDKDDFVFYDGSGLSGHDLVTPRATVKLLQYATTQPWFADWKSSLPVGGVDGSLEARFTKAPLKGRVFAKTGTLGEARALSGYVECASGRTVIFSILVGNHAPGTSADRDVMDRMVAAIAAAN